MQYPLIQPNAGTYNSDPDLPSVNNSFGLKYGTYCTAVKSDPNKSINSCAGDHSKSEPPDPFPNSEVKPLSADGSVGLPM